MFDWNDLRSFLAVAEAGSTLAAGRALRVSQTTAARRVAALEQSLGLQLFDRRQDGYALTPAGEALLDQARAMESAAAGFLDRASALAREGGGVVRLTAGDIYAVTVLPPILGELHDRRPDIRIEVDATYDLRDLSTGAADVAIRACDRPEGAGLVGRRLLTDHWAVYCSRAYQAAHGRPMRRAELPGHDFIGGGEGPLWRIYQAWLERNGLENAIAFRHASATGLLAAVRAGLGLAVLPCLVADQDPDLVQCLSRTPDEPRGLWLLTHERLRHTPRVRAVLDFLGERMTALGRAANQQG